MPIHDLVSSTASIILALLILAWTIRGAKYFREGLLAKTMRWLAVVAVFLVLHFLAISMINAGVLPESTVLDDATGILFMLALWYTVYSFAKDWKNLEKARS